MELFLPGDPICKDSGSNSCGNLVYRYGGEIRSSCLGYRKITPGIGGKTSVDISPAVHPGVVPTAGCVVLAKVTSLTRRLVRCDIVAVGDKPLAGPFRGLLRREDIRATQRDQAEPALHYRPGDLIRARVVNLIGPGSLSAPSSEPSDSTLSAARAVSASVGSTAYAALSSGGGGGVAGGPSVVVCLLSTAEPELGVVLGLGRTPDSPLASLLGCTAGAPLVPVSWTQMACPHSLVRFPRKVARLPDELLAKLVPVAGEEAAK